MPDGPNELQYSGVTRLVGSAEDRAVDTVQDASNQTRLCVDAQESMSTKFRVISNSTKQALTGATYSTVYTATGKGRLFGFHLDTSSDEVMMRLVVDGEVIFTDIRFKLLNDAGLNDGGYLAGRFLYRRAAGQGGFSPTDAIRFSSSITIQVARFGGGSYDLKQSFIFIAKE